MNPLKVVALVFVAVATAWVGVFGVATLAEMAILTSPTSGILAELSNGSSNINGCAFRALLDPFYCS